MYTESRIIGFYNKLRIRRIGLSSTSTPHTNIPASCRLPDLSSTWFAYWLWRDMYYLTHWGWVKMAAISQTAFWHAFSSKKIVVFFIKMTLKHVRKDPIYINPVLVQTTACCHVEEMLITGGTHWNCQNFQWCCGMQHRSHTQVIMVIADGLVPIWHQGICNHHDDVGRLAHVRYGSAAKRYPRT